MWFLPFEAEEESNGHPRDTKCRAELTIVIIIAHSERIGKAGGQWKRPGR